MDRSNAHDSGDILFEHKLYILIKSKSFPLNAEALTENGVINAEFHLSQKLIERRKAATKANTYIINRG